MTIELDPKGPEVQNKLHKLGLVARFQRGDFHGLLFAVWTARAGVPLSSSEFLTALAYASISPERKSLTEPPSAAPTVEGVQPTNRDRAILAWLRQEKGTKQC